MKEEPTPEMRKEAQEPTPITHNSGNLDEAIKAVYKHYGTNLPAFFRDAYEAARKHQEAVDNSAEAHQ